MSQRLTTQKSLAINVDLVLITPFWDKNSKIQCAHGAATVWSQTVSQQLIVIFVTTRISVVTQNKQPPPPNTGQPMVILITSHGTQRTIFMLEHTLMANTIDFS